MGFLDDLGKYSPNVAVANKLFGSGGGAAPVPYQGQDTAGYKEGIANPGTYVASRLSELAQHPEWNAGHEADWGRATQLYQQFSRVYGRAPTQSEINDLIPTYLQDPNLGNQQLDQQFKEYKQTPEYLKTQAGQYAPQVSGAFQSTLGRDATADESAHFGSLLASGGIDQYTLGQWLQQQPEYTNAKDKQFRSDLTGELQNQDSQYYNEKILPGITQSLTAQGRSVDSSAYAAMLAKAAQQQNTNREGFLANLTASQYGSNKANATSDYRSMLDQYYGNQNYNRTRSDMLNDSYTKRANELQDYNIQQQAYDKYLSRYGKRSPNQGYGALAGGIVGAGVGAYYGGPAGAQAGYGAGSGLGGGIGSMFS